MSESREKWTGPSGATLFWVVAVAILTFTSWGSYNIGTKLTSQTNLADRVAADEQSNALAISSAKQDATNAIATLSSSVAARFTQDEGDTKAAVASMNSVDLRLTRIEAQIDLIVKNVTTTPPGVLHR